MTATEPVTLMTENGEEALALNTQNLLMAWKEATEEDAKVLGDILIANLRRLYNEKSFAGDYQAEILTSRIYQNMPQFEGRRDFLKTLTSLVPKAEAAVA